MTQLFGYTPSMQHSSFFTLSIRKGSMAKHLCLRALSTERATCGSQATHSPHLGRRQRKVTPLCTSAPLECLGINSTY